MNYYASSVTPQPRFLPKIRTSAVKRYLISAKPTYCLHYHSRLRPSLRVDNVSRMMRYNNKPARKVKFKTEGKSTAISSAKKRNMRCLMLHIRLQFGNVFFLSYIYMCVSLLRKGLFFLMCMQLKQRANNIVNILTIPVFYDDATSLHKGTFNPKQREVKRTQRFL